MKNRFKNTDGTCTDYALACGYIDIITFPPNVRPAEAIARCVLERHAGTRAYTVRSCGRYLRRDDYNGPSLTAARKAWRNAARTLERDEQSAREAF